MSDLEILGFVKLEVSFTKSLGSPYFKPFSTFFLVEPITTITSAASIFGFISSTTAVDRRYKRQLYYSLVHAVCN